MSERTEYAAGTPSWVDQASPDPGASAGFYSDLFGWETEDVMPEGSDGEYHMATLRGKRVAALGSNPVLSVLAMMLLAMTVSLCSNVDAFFALSFASTFLPGSITAFLIIGPIIDVKMIALLRTTFRARFLVLLAVVCVLFALAVGLVMNVLV